MSKFKLNDVLIYIGVLENSQEDYIGKKCRVQYKSKYSLEYEVVFEDGRRFDSCREGNLKQISKEIKLFEED